MVKTNDIKRGWRVQLLNGWYGTMKDNARGNTRIVEVEGIYTETGSVYAHDIALAFDPATGTSHRIEYTPAQLKLKQQLAAMGW
jgi:hypothetical protein